MNTSLPPIIFIHFGISRYLVYTLSIAKINNPNRDMYLIGDAQNKKIALQCGWKHQEINQTKSDLFQKFQSIYRLVATKHHPDHHRKIDLNKFCFERYFHVLHFAQKNNIGNFWMFDSDDIIAENLTFFENKLFEENVKFTRMAYNTTPRGLINTKCLEDFCKSINENFSDRNLIKDFEKMLSEHPEEAKFSQINSGNYIAAFSDINSGELFISPEKNVHLEDSIEGWHFDDCIMDSNNFKTTQLGKYSKTKIKHIEFNGNNFVSRQNGKLIKFATINGSGLPWQTFSWFLNCTKHKNRKENFKSDILAGQPTSRQELSYIIRKKLVSILKNKIKIL